jgi:GR25 family glycosyltransferase involved in LPS biosynthesis
MSHYNLWRKISKEKEPHIILEDDAIGINSNTQIFLNKILKKLPKDYDMYLIGFVDLEPINTKSLHAKVKEFVLLHSYIITPKGAQKLLEQLPINMPVDTWISSISDKLNIYRHNIGMYFRQIKYLPPQCWDYKQEKSVLWATNYSEA